MHRLVLITGKDLRLLFFGGQGAFQAALLGLLLIFVFSLAQTQTGPLPAEWLAAVFWLSSSLGLVLIFNDLYALEETNAARIGLLMAPLPQQLIWLSKGLAGLIMLLLLQAVLLPATAVFLGLRSLPAPGLLLASLAVVDWGLVALGSLIGAVGQGHTGRDSLLTIVLLPLLMPLLIVGIRLGGALLGGRDMGHMAEWFGLAGAFDAVFTGLALLLFPLVYSES
jgi:heme exporter protein B